MDTFPRSERVHKRKRERGGGGRKRMNYLGSLAYKYNPMLTIRKDNKYHILERERKKERERGELDRYSTK